MVGSCGGSFSEQSASTLFGNSVGNGTFDGRPSNDLGDYNRDGNIDIFTWPDEPQDPDIEAQLYRNDITGTFSVSIQLDTSALYSGNARGLGACVIARKSGSIVGTSCSAMNGYTQTVSNYFHIGTNGNGTVDIEVVYPHGNGSETFNDVPAGFWTITYVAGSNNDLIASW